MDSLSFSRLLDPDTENHPVAWQPQAGQSTPLIHDLRGFQSDVARAVATISSASEPGQNNAAMLYLTNSYQFAVGFTALVYLQKTIFLPANDSPGAVQQLQAACDNAIVDTSLAERLSGTEQGMPVLDLEQTLNHARQDSFSNPQWPVPRHDAQSEVVIYTSGSTGKARAIHKRLDCFLTEVHALESLWGNRLADSAVLATVSHQHVYGLLFRLLWPLLSQRPFGATTVQYPEELQPQAALHPATVLVSSPAFLSRLPNHQAADAASGATPLVQVFSSGGPLDPADNFAVQSLLKCPVTEVFGSTETGGVGYRERAGHNDPLGWIPLPGVEVRQSPASRRLVVKSPYLFTDEWYEMGDVAVVDEHRHFHIQGRADRIVKIEEKRISLDEIEARLQQCASVRSAKVLPLEGKRRVLGAVLVLSEPGNQLLAREGKLTLTRQLRKELARHLEPVVIPRKWRIVDTLPVNTQGKITHAALQQLFTNPINPD